MAHSDQEPVMHMRDHTSHFKRVRSGQQADAAREAGNSAARAGEWATALNHYERCLSILSELCSETLPVPKLHEIIEKYRLKPEDWDEAKAIEQALHVSADDAAQGTAHANASLACLKLRRYELALAHADSAVAASPSWGKAHGRRAEALAMMGIQLEAESAACKALQLDPSLRISSHISTP